MTTLAIAAAPCAPWRGGLAPSGTFVLEGLYRRRNEIAMPRRRIPHARGVLRIEEAWFPIGRTTSGTRVTATTTAGPTDPCARRRPPSSRAWNPATIGALFAEAGLEITALWETSTGGLSGGTPRASSSRRASCT